MLKVMAPFAPFASLDGARSGAARPGYYAFKERMADALVAAASEVVPGLSEAVVVREVATPLTYRDWGHRSEGSVAGWSWRARGRSRRPLPQPGPHSRAGVVRGRFAGLHAVVPGRDGHVALQRAVRRRRRSRGYRRWQGEACADLGYKTQEKIPAPSA